MKNDGAVLKSLNSISSKITKLCDRVEAIKGRTPERIAVITYFLCRILMAFVHEPWFDEALAWLIARDSSISEILFTAPHYEGHPSLWHLVLMPFAKLGAPYELSMNLVSLIFSGIAMALFIYKAPFKRIIRIIMPFTYFMFYQYSVVNRPYCMMMLAFVLMAITYNKRNEHPGRFVLSLCFLCATGAYGLVIAGGICMVWLIEMLREGCFLKKGKAFWLIALLAYAVFIIYRIIPAEDAFAVLNGEDGSVMPFPLRLLYMTFGMIADLFITNTYFYGVTLTVSNLGFVEILAAAIIGIAILTGFIIFAKTKKKLLLFILPYGMLIISMSYLYMSRHHMGIALLFLLFFLWICKEEKDSIIELEGHNASIAVIILTIGIIVPLYWSISSSVVDIICEYSLGRDEYYFLEKNELQNKTILAEWSDMPLVNKDDKKPISFSGVITALLPYMDTDTFVNSPSKAGYNYSLIHKVPSNESTENIIAAIKDRSLPDIIIGEPELSMFYPTILKAVNYDYVYEGSGGLIWKGVPEMNSEKIYVRKDLLTK